MKKLSSVFYMGVGVAISLLAVLTMHLPFLQVDGSIVSASSIFWSSGAGTIKGAWPAFVGFMLILASAIALLILALPYVQPSAKVEKIVLISVLTFQIVGAILVLFVGVIYSSMNPIEVSTVSLCPGWFIFLVLMLLDLGCSVMALVLDW